jgi:hypothetical protein
MIKQPELKTKIFIALLVLQFSGTTCFAQKGIIYTFDKCVTDSLIKGVELYSALLKKPAVELKLFVLVTGNDCGYGLYLQEYSHLPKSGFLETINLSNRKLRLFEKLDIPILYSLDILSEQIRRDKIFSIPYSGYYLKIQIEKSKQKVTQVSFLF